MNTIIHQMSMYFTLHLKKYVVGYRHYLILRLSLVGHINFAISKLPMGKYLRKSLGDMTSGAIVIWILCGGVRNIITDDILERYDKIGFQGHSTLYRNTRKNNRRYRIEIPGHENFRGAFTSEKTWNFDEKAINCIYNSIGVPFYSETTFSTLAQYRRNFVARYWPQKDSNKNKHVIYVWEEGKLFHVSAYRGQVYKDEVMYVHWQKRKMKVECEGTECCIIVVPNRIFACKSEPSSMGFVMASSKSGWLTYLKNIFADNKGESVVFWMKFMKRFITYNWRVKFHNEIKQDING